MIIGKIIKWIIRLVFLIMVLFGIFFTIDKSRTSKNKMPIFTAKTATYKDGSVRYTGLFYTVYHIKQVEDFGGGEATVDYGYHLERWFASFDDVKDKAIKKGPVLE